jgi:arylsulfatase A-like enzyme|tara:strand:+ start:643 stop:2256 length:1614 start_codon:yes stop_codon:yes gene_type:complete
MTPGKALAPKRPNVLWIVAEDMSANIPAFGDATIETPHLSRLANEGVCYDNFFTPAAVCAPARAAIATGMYPSRIAANHMRTGPWYYPNPSEQQIVAYSGQLPEGVPVYEAMPPVGTRMMSEVLREEGYYCTNNSKSDYQFRASPLAWDESGTSAHWRGRGSRQPFFSIFNLGVTHESQIWSRANEPLLVDEDLDVPVPPYLPDTVVGRRDIRRMYSNIKAMDNQVGSLMEQLEQDGLLEETIIFWYTDHGGPLPRQKRLLYDSGMRVPMIIRFPGKINADTRNDDLVSFIDLAATVHSIAGIEPSPLMDGQAFLGSYRDEEPARYVHAAADRFDMQTDKIRAVRDSRFKYLRYYDQDKPFFLPVAYREQMPIMRELHRLREAGELTVAQRLWFRATKPGEELFDTESDPHELNNLADDPAHERKLKELRAECDRWLKDIEDLNLLPERDLIDRLWPDGRQPVAASPKISIRNRSAVISCATAGASLGYKIVRNGKEPPSWSIFTGPFSCRAGDLILAVSHRIGFKRGSAQQKVTLA